MVNARTNSGALISSVNANDNTPKVSFWDRLIAWFNDNFPYSLLIIGGAIIGLPIITFLTLNASGFCLIPQGIISIRGTYIDNAFDIILPSFLLSMFAFFTTIVLNKVLIKYDK